MKPILIVNLHTYKGHQFLVVRVFDALNQHVDDYMNHCFTAREAVEAIKQIAEAFDSPVEVWTSTNSIFKRCFREPSIHCRLKHPSDTEGTKFLFESHKDDLMEIHGLLPKTNKTVHFPKWKLKLLCWLYRKIEQTQS